MPGLAERIEILLAVSDDLLKRTYASRKMLAAATADSLSLSDKIAKRFLEKFPEVALVKEKDPGFERFMTGAQAIVDALTPFFTILCQILEFRDHALVLIHEMSTQIGGFSLEVNAMVFAGYYNLVLNYAKLHLLVGLLGTPSGHGKLALAALARAHTTRYGHSPAQYEHCAAFMLDYEQPLLRLQDDMSKAKLRVADVLLPTVASQLLRLSDPTYLRAEPILAPLPSAGGATVAVNKGADDGTAHLSEVLLHHLSEARQWLIYGLLLSPDDLGAPGAVDQLISVLNGCYVLPIYGSDFLMPHSEFDSDSKAMLRWLKKKEEVKRFQAAIKE